MAVGGNQSGGRRFLVGVNVSMMIVLAVALVAGVQYIGYTYSARADMTGHGINSLSESTERVLEALDSDVRITSLYFQNPIEEEDQSRYRSAVADLIDLFRATNRTHIVGETVNPLEDQDKRKALIERLIKIPRFKEQAQPYRDAIETFRDQRAPAISELLTQELGQLETMAAMGETDTRLVGQVKLLYERTQEDVEAGLIEIGDALASEVPTYSVATNVIRQIYNQTKKLLESVIEVGKQAESMPGKLSPPVASFFADAKKRYESLLADLDAGLADAGGLPGLDLDEILRSLGPMSNPVVVETTEDAKVIDFASMWPIADRNRGATGIDSRRFAGEQRLTAAILQLTRTTRPAVVFVRFGGPPLLAGGFMPGQPQALLGQMKKTLEDVNFTVQEWDLSTQDDMPEIDPEPERVIFVVRPPSAPPRGPMGQPPQQPPFSDQDLEKLKSAMGDNYRALFMAGYQFGQFGMPQPYQYNAFLKETFGLSLEDDRLLLKAEPIGPEKYRFYRDPLRMSELSFSDHPIVDSLGSASCMLPLVTPINLDEPPPADVTVETLAWIDRQDGLWAVKDIDYYAKQQANEFIIKQPEDYEGRFIVSAAATRGETKVVLIASTDFAADAVALATQPVLTSQGISFRRINPGNVTWFVNSLHWLNDNIEWMNLGSPIEKSTITVDRDSSEMQFVSIFAWGIWPGLALACGMVVWWVRRS